MYAVINTGGKQYRVEVGQTFRTEKLPGEVGSQVNFDRVLLFSDGQNLQIGCPLVENVIVSGRIVEQGKSQKIIVFKYKRRKRYRRKQGHRQAYTAIRIDRISYPGSEKAEPAPDAVSLSSTEEQHSIEAKTLSSEQSEPVSSTQGSEASAVNLSETKPTGSESSEQ